MKQKLIAVGILCGTLGQVGTAQAGGFRTVFSDEGAAAEREGFEPSGGVGNNLRRHATLHANAWKSCSKCFGSLSPLVPVSQRGSSGVGPGWAVDGQRSTLAR
jgi:hypothetical protein